MAWWAVGAWVALAPPGAPRGTEPAVVGSSPVSGAEAALEVERPAEGALLGTREFVVAGRVVAKGQVKVQVNGIEAVVTEDRFEVRVTAPSDGAYPMLVAVTGEGGGTEVVRREVTVDATAPEVEMTEPSTLERTVPAEQGKVGVMGRVREANLEAVTVDGSAVAVAADGTFAAGVALSEGETRDVAVEATDRAGHRSTPVSVRLKRERPRAAWASDVEEAVSQGRGGDWEGATGAWGRAVGKGATEADLPGDVREGILAWNRLPELDVGEPKDGAEFPLGTVAVRGVLKSGRGSDVVKVNGTEARRGPGVFEATVAAAAAGRLTIVVTVEGRGEKASTRVERKRAGRGDGGAVVGEGVAGAGGGGEGGGCRSRSRTGSGCGSC